MVGLISHWLPEHHHHPPLSAPVTRHPHKLNFYLGIVIVAFMAVSVVALVCCCYRLEWRLRLQARNAARRVSWGNGILTQNTDGSHEIISARVGKKTKQIHMKVQRRIHPQLFGSVDDIGFTQQMREWSRFQPMSFREGNEDHPLQIGGNGGSQTWNTFHAYVFAKIDVPPLISSVLQTLCFRMRIDHKGWVIRSWWEELEHFSTRLWMVLVWHLLRWE